MRPPPHTHTALQTPLGQPMGSGRVCTDRQTDRHAWTDRPQGLGKGGHDTATPKACRAPAAAPIGEGNPWGPPQTEISIPATPQPHSLSCRPHQGPTGIPTPIFWGGSAPPSYPPHPHHAPTPLEGCPQGWGSQGWDAGGLGVLGGSQRVPSAQAGDTHTSHPPGAVRRGGTWPGPRRCHSRLRVHQAAAGECHSMSPPPPMDTPAP